MAFSPLARIELLLYLAYLVVVVVGVSVDGGGGSSILIVDAPANNDKRFGRVSFTCPQLNTSYMDVDIRCKSTFCLFLFICIFCIVSMVFDWYDYSSRMIWFMAISCVCVGVCLVTCVLQEKKINTKCLNVNFGVFVMGYENIKSTKFRWTGIDFTYDRAANNKGAHNS